MTKPIYHTIDSARQTLAEVHAEVRIKERIKAKATRREQSLRICENKRLLKTILRDMRGPDINFRAIALQHDVPHHVIMYIWRRKR